MADLNDRPAAKPCKKCGIEKPLTSEFFTPQKAGKYGFTSRCRECRAVDYAEQRARPDQQARQQAWRDANKDYVKRYNEQYRRDGYCSTAHVNAWRAENLEYCRAYDREKQRRRREADPAFRLLGRIRGRLRDLAGGRRGRRTEALLGYTMEQLRAHIEKQFTKGMSWAAFERGEIEIDHIIPVCKFRIESFDDPAFRVCWGLPNLRPLWKQDNRSKGGKVLTLL